MEPTQKKAGGGNRPSAAKRYGPIAAIIAIIVVVAIIVVATGGSDDKKATTPTNGGSASATDGKATWPLFDKSDTKTDWGPNCDTDLGKIEIPWVRAVPCAKQLEGDNGGATTTGVTGDAIKIVVYQGDPAKNPLQAATVSNTGADVSPASARLTYDGYFKMFEKYYNTYGRKLDIVYFPGTGGPADEVTARADANAIADMKPFAVLSGPTQTPVWTETIASRDVLCLGNCSLAVPNQTVVDNAPYLMGTGPTPEQAGLMTSKLVTNLLKGKNAVYGGDAVKNKKRVFGVTHYDTVDGQQRAAYGVLKDSLSKGGVKIAADLPFQLDLARGQENARTMIAKLKAAKVTTVIYTGDPLTPAYLTKEATAQNYFPEWVIGSNVLVDIAVFGRTYDQEQWQHAFGLALNGARVNQDVNPGYSLYQWFNGEPPPDNTYGVILTDIWQLVSGIHEAGPNLTPETYKAAVFNAPINGGSPLAPQTSRGMHGFWPGVDWGGSDDTGLLWWNPKARGENEIGNVGDGLYEFTANGKRWTLADMPTTDPGLFKASGSVTIFTEAPKADQTPDYPSPAKK
ncbi:MAG: hypothetical protein JJE46_01365 [Acidimicrobiia bacterium]|nr:hypothetical protein [Acidimicrobiia bacterium]